MTQRIRWRDARKLDNGIVHKLAIWLGVTCSPSLHAGWNRCTRHRNHGVDRLTFESGWLRSALDSDLADTP